MGQGGGEREKEGESEGQGAGEMGGERDRAIALLTSTMGHTCTKSNLCDCHISFTLLQHMNSRGTPR